jgi:hydrogenase maturation protease
MASFAAIRGMAPSSLLIGIGNPLRGDDGVGPWLVESWRQRRAAQEAPGDQGRGTRADVQVTLVDQLLPELAAELATVDRVLFVDAWQAPLGAAPQLLVLASPGGLAGRAGEASPLSSWAPSHRLRPTELLALTQHLFGRAPHAGALLIPAHRFAATDPEAAPGCFSSELRRQLSVACHSLEQWLGQG